MDAAYDEPDGELADEGVSALGVVVDDGRGSLPFLLVHGESLVACASWALGEAGVTAVDLGTGWDAVVESGEPFVLHDSLCPMVPASFLAECLARAVGSDVVVVAVRPVTDTVKQVTGGAGHEGGRLGETLDRDRLHTVVSPIVLPASVVATIGPPDTGDFAALAARLAQVATVELVDAPAQARRVAGPDDVRLLEALTAR